MISSDAHRLLSDVTVQKKFLLYDFTVKVIKLHFEIRATANLEEIKAEKVFANDA